LERVQVEQAAAAGMRKNKPKKELKTGTADGYFFSIGHLLCKVTNPGFGNVPKYVDNHSIR
jgi:hypothetical protein